LFNLGLSDIDDPKSPWTEVLKNERINRRLLSGYLSVILQEMVTKNQATFDPPKQSASALLYWNTPEQWAEILYEWATSTGQLNTILTFYEIMEPPLESPLSGIPVVLLRKAVIALNKTGRAQLISVADGEGVKLIPHSGREFK
jgi:ESCRT-II complex subunit VPS25